MAAIQASQILILGDGNLSFSLTFSQRLATIRDKSLHLIATTFDSFVKLSEKYPETAHVLQELSSTRFRDWVTVEHDIDAMQLSSHYERDSFSVIIFNFPHLGVEDIRRHQAFLAHLFHSCQNVLQEDGLVYVALAETQEVGWELMKAASRLHFVLIDKILIQESDWPGYDIRRHQTGKSFHRRVGRCFHYCFRRATSTDRVENLIAKILRSNIEAPKSTATEAIVVAQEVLGQNAVTESQIGRETVAESVSQESSNVELASGSITHMKPPTTKKRKMHALVEGRYKKVVTAMTSSDSSPTARPDAQESFVCLDCAKSFATEQGVRTHVYTTHVLHSSSSPSSSQAPAKLAKLLSSVPQFTTCYSAPSTAVNESHDKETASLHCAICVRDFRNPEALLQHQIAKHLVLPSPVASSSSTTSGDVPADVVDATEAGEEEQCSICMWQLTNADRKLHTMLFQPRDLTFSHTCPTCTRKFATERSWQQHTNFCRLVHVSTSTASASAAHVPVAGK